MSFPKTQQHNIHKQQQTKVTELADKDIKTAIINMLHILTNIEENMREMEETSKIPFNSFLCLLMLKNTVSEIKDSLDRLRRLDISEDRTNESEDSKRNYSNWSQQEKKTGKKSPKLQWLKGYYQAI